MSGTLALLGNGIVILLIVARNSLRKHPSPNWFILSLAVADLCVGGLYAPSRLVCVYFDDKLCPPPTWGIVLFFQSVFLNSSVSNLCALTFDRYLAVVHPFHYQNTMTKTRVIHIIEIAWFSAIVLNIPYLIMEFASEDLALRISILRFVHIVAQMIIFAFIPCAFMIYAYLVIFLILRRHRNDILRQEMQLAANFQLEVTVNRHHGTTRDGTMKAVAVIVAFFLLCTGLFQWLTICHLVESCNSVPNDSVAYFIIFTLLHFKSVINVVVYALLRADFQKELKNLFCIR